MGTLIIQDTDWYHQEEELIDGVSLGGVATMLGASDESNMSLFI